MKYLLIFLLVCMIVSCTKKNPIDQKQTNWLSYSKNKPPSGMIYIPAGSFLMGDIKGEQHYGEYLAHRVRVSAFFMDTTKITYLSYRNAFDIKTSDSIDLQYPFQGIWNSAIMYCNKRSQNEGLQQVYKFDKDGNMSLDLSAKGYRLPTEAEWEYACRAGTKADFYWGDDPHLADNYEWSETVKGQTIHKVGQKKPNAFHLYDMLGDAKEWCWNLYEDSYRVEDSIDPTGPSSGKYRVLRGGDSASLSTCWVRGKANENRLKAGFRCVLSAPDSSDFTNK
jgi:sulfatase modifying factor 1